MRSRDIEKAELICSFTIIPHRGFNRITGIAKVDKAHALNHATFFDV
jgi:hypothetical protein